MMNLLQPMKFFAAITLFDKVQGSLNPICHGLKEPGLNLTHHFNDFQILFLQGLRYIYKGQESKI